MSVVNEMLLSKILESERLPSLPAVAAQVVDLCSNENTGLCELGEVLRNDPALSLKILRTINSSYYGMRTRVTTVDRAVMMLGLNAVKMLALGFSLVPALQDSTGQNFDPTPLWRRSLFSAVGACAIGRCVGVEQSEQAFIGGLLQDLGVFALLQCLRSDYLPIINEAIDDHSKLQAIEQERLQLDHTEVGMALAEKWLLPQSLSITIGYHERPNKAPQQYLGLVRAVALGAKAADCFFCNEQGSFVKDYFRSAKSWFDIESAQAGELLEVAFADSHVLAKLFEINTSGGRQPEDILAAANETLLSLSLEATQTAQQLEQVNRDLQEQTQRDPLTDAANRSWFDQFLKQHFAQCHESKSTLSVIFADIDQFKTVNDTHGHQTGDHVLKALAKILTDAVAADGLVARYGGEEFVIALPDVSLEQATALADTCHQTLENLTLTSDEDVQVRVTVSMGVAAYHGDGSFDQAEQLVDAADRAMYAAKAAGRNRVHVYDAAKSDVSKSA